jgi:hypothetical protein
MIHIPWEDKSHGSKNLGVHLNDAVMASDKHA